MKPTLLMIVILCAGCVAPVESTAPAPAQAESNSPKIVQSLDRSFTLHARDATVHGTMLRYETQPHKNTLGYWSQASDWVSWDFEVTHPGEFIVFAMQGAPGGGSEIEITAAGQTFNWTVANTGSYHTFTFLEVGKLTFPEPGPYTLTLKPTKKVGGAVMDLRKVILLPVLD